MPDRVRARALLAALLILLTVAGIHALGPPGDWGRHVKDGVIIGVVLEVVLASLMTVLRWGRRPPAGELAARLYRMLSTGIVVVMIGVVVAIILATYRPTPKVLKAQHPPNFRLRKQPGHTRLTESNFHLGPAITDILIAIVVLAIVWTVLMALRNRRRRLANVADIEITEIDDDDLARAVESGRVALRDLDDARAAIIACYVAMEQSLAEAGAARGAAETPDELLVRAVAAGLVSPGPAGVLTRLFYEARFSTHPMPMSQRDEAERALADIAAGLGVGELT